MKIYKVENYMSPKIRFKGGKGVLRSLLNLVLKTKA